MSAASRERTDDSDRLVDRLASLDEYRMARRSAQRAAAPEPQPQPLKVTEALPLESISVALLTYRDAPKKTFIPPLQGAESVESSPPPVLPAVDADPLASGSRLVALMREQRTLIERLAESAEQPGETPQADVGAAMPVAAPSDVMAFGQNELAEPPAAHMPEPTVTEGETLLDQIMQPVVISQDAHVPFDPPRGHTAEEIIRALSGVDLPPPSVPDMRVEPPPPEEPLARYEARSAVAADLPPGTVMEVPPPPSVPAPLPEPEFPFAGLDEEAEVTIRVGASARVLPHEAPIVQMEAERAALLAEVERPPMIIERAQAAQLDPAALTAPVLSGSRHSPVPGFLFGISLSIAAGAALYMMLQPV
jgi:hypothetical protein